jgi:hypothetical protein
VAGSTTQVFSSASGDYVPVADGTYQTWLAAGNKPSRIVSEAELGEVLAQHNVVPAAATVLDAFKGTKADRLPVDVILKVLFNHENRIRDLAGQPTVSPAQFRNALKNLL